MIFYGWGKDLKQIAYVGIEKCRNCKNFGHFWLCENSSYASLYFVTVARWSKKYFLMCELCQRGFEIDKTAKDDLLRTTVSLPTRSQVEEIWNRLDKAYSEAVTSAGEQGDLIFRNVDEAVQQLSVRHSRMHISYVSNRYADWLGDDDPPG